MSDESSKGQGLTDPVHPKKRESPTRHKPNGKRANGSDQQADALFKQQLQKKTQQTQISAKAFEVEVVDGTTIKLSVYENARMFGTDSQDTGFALAKQVCGLVPTAAGKPDVQSLKGALSLVQGIGPKDELEGLLAAQMVGAHNLAMEFLKRASAEGQSPVLIEATVNLATKLMRTFTAQMEALNRHRGKISQQMVVGNVNVGGEGGQAIVGTVSHNGREKNSKKDDPDKVE